MQHFSAGLSTLVSAFVVSVIGSLIGLARARAEPARAVKVRWTVFGALAIGGEQPGDGGAAVDAPHLG